MGTDNNYLYEKFLVWFYSGKFLIDTVKYKSYFMMCMSEPLVTTIRGTVHNEIVLFGAALIY